MHRNAARLLLLAALTGCSRPAIQAASPDAPVCRVGPDGGPAGVVVTDKGIGGTGAPADRGIGGTGGVALADRGIGGTGIVAVITGFGSICLAGREVALPDDTPILLGTEPAQADALRAGQVAVVDARQTDGELSARRVTVRFEVSGPVEAVAGDRLRVAGQDVTVTAQTAGLRPAVGDWIAVSGLRRVDGTIEATRLQARPAGPVMVHGVLRHEAAGYRIGTLPVAPTPVLPTLVDREVTASGSLLLGEVQTESVVPDLLASDPAAFFGPSVETVLFEGYGQLGGDRLRLGPDLELPVAGPVAAGRRVYRLERGPGGLRAVGGPGEAGPRAGGVGALPRDLSTGDRSFGPAPVPNRGVGGAGSGQPFGRVDGAGPTGAPSRGAPLLPGAPMGASPGRSR